MNITSKLADRLADLVCKGVLTSPNQIDKWYENKEIIDKIEFGLDYLKVKPHDNYFKGMTKDIILKSTEGKVKEYYLNEYLDTIKGEKPWN